MPIYRVAVETALYVVADNLEEAEDIALSNAREEEYGACLTSKEVKDINDVDPGWINSIPYGDNTSDKTIREYFDE